MSKENQNIEWKESWREEYFKWVCGFANAQGGRLFIGKVKVQIMFKKDSQCAHNIFLLMLGLF